MGWKQWCPKCQKETETTCCACGCGDCLVCGHRFSCLPLQMPETLNITFPQKHVDMIMYDGVVKNLPPFRKMQSPEYFI